MGGIVKRNADWVGAVEAMLDTRTDGAGWWKETAAAMAALFHGSAFSVGYTIEHSPDFQSLDLALGGAPVASPLFARLLAVSRERGPEAWAPFHFGPSVFTFLACADLTVRDAYDVQYAALEAAGARDSINLCVHPKPGTILVLAAAFEDPVTLSRHDRERLSCLAMHLEAAARLRQAPESVLAEIGSNGRVDLHAPAGLSRSLVRRSVASVDAARTRRGRRADALALWRALIEGRASVVPRGDSYLVLENPPKSRTVRALLPAETTVLDLAARGLSGKDIAYALGLTTTAVSALQGRAMRKMGLMSRVELVRLAALLANVPRSQLSDAALTNAEREVLRLLEQGLSNAKIAKLRARSVRTIANQVASLLRKTATASRSELVAVSAGRR